MPELGGHLYADRRGVGAVGGKRVYRFLEITAVRGTSGLGKAPELGWTSFLSQGIGSSQSGHSGKPNLRQISIRR